MEVECIGKTQIIHMEETGITQRKIGLKCQSLTEGFGDKNAFKYCVPFKTETSKPK